MAPAKQSGTQAGSAVGGAGPAPVRRRWRDYKTQRAAGRSRRSSTVSPSDDAAAVFAGMPKSATAASRRPAISTARSGRSGSTATGWIYRILFASEGSRGQILLHLRGCEQEPQKTPPGDDRAGKATPCPTAPGGEIESAAARRGLAFLTDDHVATYLR